MPRKQLRVEFQRIRNVRSKISVVMPPGIKMKLMRDVPRSENLVQRRRAGLESVIVLIPTIKVNLQSGKIRGARNGDRTVLLPKRRIGWTPKRSAKHTRTRRPLYAAEKSWQLVDQR